MLTSSLSINFNVFPPLLCFIVQFISCKPHFFFITNLQKIKILFQIKKPIVVGLFYDFGMGWPGLPLAVLGPSILDKRVGTGPIVTHFDMACAQTMPCLPKLWSHAHGRRSCNGRIMASRCNNSNERKYFCH